MNYVVNENCPYLLISMVTPEWRTLGVYAICLTMDSFALFNYLAFIHYGVFCMLMYNLTFHAESDLALESLG
jgi:hypothetical protein